MINVAAAIALIVMLQLPGREQAQHWANLAHRLGAKPNHLADAWADWERAHQPLAVEA